jgi:hypothetical protein
MANELLHELAPLLAEEGIDVDNIDVPDLDTLQAAMERAVERHKERGALGLALFGGLGYVQASHEVAISPLDMTALLRAVLHRLSPSPTTGTRSPAASRPC